MTNCRSLRESNQGGRESKKGTYYRWGEISRFLMTKAESMTNDESKIRNLVKTWLDATRDGDFATVLNLMSDEVIFMVPGKEPFGKEVFAANSESLKNVRIEGTSDIRELQVLGDWAWIRNYLNLTVTMPDGKSTRRSGYTPAIFRKQADGSWLLTRDAGLVA